MSKNLDIKISSKFTEHKVNQYETSPLTPTGLAGKMKPKLSPPHSTRTKSIPRPSPSYIHTSHSSLPFPSLPIPSIHATLQAYEPLEYTLPLSFFFKLVQPRHSIYPGNEIAILRVGLKCRREVDACVTRA